MTNQTFRDLHAMAVTLDTQINQLRYSPEVVPDTVHQALAGMETTSKQLVKAIEDASGTVQPLDSRVRPGETVQQRDARLRAGNRMPGSRPTAEDFTAGHPRPAPVPAAAPQPIVR